jgi:hypothetical protein
MIKLCPNHSVPLRLETTAYGGRWQCTVSGCDVACWDGSTSTPADGETRRVRHETHQLFDPIWQKPGVFPGKRGLRRKQAYRWLAETMGLTRDDAHIGMFSREQCEQVQVAIQRAFPQVGDGL